MEKKYWYFAVFFTGINRSELLTHYFGIEGNDNFFPLSAAIEKAGKFQINIPSLNFISIMHHFEISELEYKNLIRMEEVIPLMFR